MRVLTSWPVLFFKLPARTRLSVVVLSFLICMGLNLVILPVTHNGSILVIPIILTAWLFRYRGMLLCEAISILIQSAIYSYMLGTVFWPPSFVLFVVTGFLAGFAIGLIVSYLRHTVDLVETAQLRTLQAEQREREALQVEQRMTAAFEQQRQLNQLKDQFILGINHELRTPLTQVYGFLELLNTYREQLDATMQAMYLKKAMEGCEELMLLITNVLDATQIKSGGNSSQCEEVPVVQVVREVLDHFDPQTQQAYTIHLDISEQLSVWADKQFTRQILRNLLSNAFKYSPQHTTIAITAAMFEDDPQQTDTTSRVCVSVKDSGPGIPADELPLLFEKFVRLKRDAAGSIRGSGLGLYISKQLVEVMGGHIWVESSGRAGEGSCFRFTLLAGDAARKGYLVAS